MLSVSQRASSAAQRTRRPAFESFEQALASHAQGRLPEAEQLYRRVLETDERHFGAVHGLGLIRLQQARFADAVNLFRRAVKIDRNSAEAHHHLGVALTGLGRAEDAVERFEKALAIRPDFAEAHDSLGHALQMLGRTEAAIAHHERAVAIKPDYAEARNNLGNALQKLGRSEKALAQYEKALSIRPDYPEAHNNLGNLLQNLGRHQEALAHYEKALAIRPHYAEAYLNAGHALGALGRQEEGLTQYQKALAAAPDNPDVHNSLGNVLLMLGRTEEAVAHCERAIAIKPQHVEAHTTLGNALRTLGRLDKATRAFEKAIALAPNKPAGYWGLVMSRRIIADEPCFMAMTNLARDMASLKIADRIDLHFALGKAFADVGDQRQSFHHLLEGNSRKRQLVTYDETKTLEWFKRIRAAFAPQLMRDKAPVGEPSPVPIFIIGMPRSGTTLVEQILASHPKIFGAGELPDFGNLAKSFCGPHGTCFPEAVPAAPRDQLCRLGERYLQAVRRMAPTAERITDKMPYNFIYAGLIHLALPNARIIHTRRDLRDTALSCFSLLFPAGQEYSYDLAELGRYCRAYRELMEHWRSVLPQGVMLEVQYEEIVADLEEQARRIVAHCGLEWSAACLAFHKTERDVRTASATQVRQPIYQSSVGRWRRYADSLRPLLETLGGSSDGRMD
jgi:tetratricopeptide (TPR) repeat protein